MRTSFRLVPLAFLLAASLGCGSRQPLQTYRIPPRVDLAALETIGVVEFRSTAGERLGTFATRRFEESARRDQGLVRMVDLGKGEKDAETLRVRAKERGVRTLLVGELTVSKVKPNVRISPDLGSGSVTAEVNGTLAVRLVEAETGASIWSRSAAATRSLGEVGVYGKKDVVFGADDPEQAYAALVDGLVAQVTRDFHVTWERR